MKRFSSRSYRLQALLLAAVLLAVTYPGNAAQQKGHISAPNPEQHNGVATPEDDVWLQQQQKAMAKKANLQREQDIKKDAEKLLELATELKQSVDKSNENTLSLDVIKKAEQIEKLAKSVKEKMKGT